MAIVARYVGLCICCERRIKVRNGLMVHHGFRRPGCGYIVDGCFGALKEPHEISSNTAKEFQKFLFQYWISERKVLLYALNNPEKIKNGMLQDQESSKNINYYTKNIDKVYESYIHAVKNRIRYCKFDLKRIKKAIKDWEKKDLITFKEEQAKKAKEKANRAQEIADKRKAKIDAEILKLQKRIDSAVKRNNFHALANLFSDAPRKIISLSNYKIKRDEVFKMLDRDDVWRRLNVLSENGEYMKKQCFFKIADLKEWPK